MVKTDKGYLQMYKIFGKSETEIKERLAGLLECRGGLSVTVRRRAKEVQVLLETEETDEETAKQYIKPAGKAVKKALGDMIYSSKENETMEEAVYRLLAKYGLTAATARVLYRRPDGCKARQRAGRIGGLPCRLYYLFQQGKKEVPWRKQGDLKEIRRCQQKDGPGDGRGRRGCR